jgi:hypothetical protein
MHWRGVAEGAIVSRSSSQLQVVDVAEDEAAFKRGRGPMLVGLLLAAALAALGLWQILSVGDDARVYGELGRKINGLRQSQFDEFWGCALDGTDLHELKSNTDLIAQLAERAADGGNSYAHYLRDECAGKLGEINQALDALIIPDDLKSDVESLKEATSLLRNSLRAFITILDDPLHDYDPVLAKPRLDSIARGWFDFQTAHAAINKTLKAKLERRAS